MKWLDFVSGSALQERARATCQCPGGGIPTHIYPSSAAREWPARPLLMIIMIH